MTSVAEKQGRKLEKVTKILFNKREEKKISNIWLSKQIKCEGMHRLCEIGCLGKVSWETHWTNRELEVQGSLRNPCIELRIHIKQDTYSGFASVPPRGKELQ